MTLLLLALTAALAGGTESPDAADAASSPKASWLFDRELVPPDARYEGNFDRAPAPHWRAPLPGDRVNAATHAERARAVIDGDTLLVGSAGGKGLYRLSRRDGALVQTYPAGGSVESEAVVADGAVYFTDTSGRTWCYELDGTLRWKHQSGAPILVQPTVTNDLVYVTNVDDLAVALDRKTGELRWRYQRKVTPGKDTELALFAAPPATVVDDLVLLGFSDGALVALDPVRGDLKWERSVGEGRYPDLVAAPAIYGSDIYTSGYFKPLVALDRASRNVRWRLDVGAANAPLLDEGQGAPHLLHPGTDGVLRSVVVLTGAVDWTWDSGTDGALTTPQLTEAGILIGSSSGGLYLIDPLTGTEIWRYRGDRMLEGLSSAPTLSGRQLLFTTNAGFIYSMLVPQHSARSDQDLWMWKRNQTRAGDNTPPKAEETQSAQ